jgi:hypothetical protein
MKDDNKLEKNNLTFIEINTNRYFAILLVVATIPYLMNIFTIPTIAIYVAFACFLWFNKKYSFLTTLIFLTLALVIYFFNI